jgi:hypothetical protein
MRFSRSLTIEKDDPRLELLLNPNQLDFEIQLFAR